MTGDEESRLPGSGDALGFGPEESESTVGEEGKGLGADEADALVVDMGAALDTDEDATKAAADTSLDREEFETGAGFDLEGVPDGGDQHPEIEAMEVSSSSFDEFDPEEASSSAKSGVEDLGVDGDFGGTDDVDRSVSDRAVSSPAFSGHVDLRVADHDEVSLLLPTPTEDEARQKARHLGLAALERRRKRSRWARQLITVSAVLILGGGGFAAVYWDFVEIPARSRTGLLGNIFNDFRNLRSGTSRAPHLVYSRGGSTGEPAYGVIISWHRYSRHVETERTQWQIKM